MRKYIDIPTFLIGLSLINSACASEQAVGFYSNGSLINAKTYEKENEQSVLIFSDRNRNFATTEMINLISSAASELKKQLPENERLQIGDFSQKGGKTITRHSSHQNGLDVDLAYFKKSKVEQTPNKVDGFDEVFVKDARLSDNFDIERNYALITHLIKQDNVERIFIDPIIKKSLCDFAVNEMKLNADDQEFINQFSKLRPYPNHADHIHVRIKCPANSPRCTAQNPIPVLDGCKDVAIIETL